MLNFDYEELKKSIGRLYCTNIFRDIKDDFATQFDSMRNTIHTERKLKKHKKTTPG
jgi:hypothetical protein